MSPSRINEGRDSPLRHGGMGGPRQKRQAVRSHQAGRPGVEGPVRQAAGHREGVQVDEGVETAGAALCPGAAADHPSRHDVGIGLSGDGAGEAEDGAGRYDAVDGREGSLVWLSLSLIQASRWRALLWSWRIPRTVSLSCYSLLTRLSIVGVFMVLGLLGLLGL